MKGITVCLSGANAADTAKTLGARLIELGHNAEQIDSEAVNRLGGLAGAAHACLLLSRNGVIAVSTCAGLKPEGETLAVEIDGNDTPDFAAEKILDTLASAGLVSLETGDYSPEEEEQIRRRLASLGYIE
ncbi:MAG: hypothetical protein HZB26_22925 [Candidatus Hydrogenedentes bacterium]|nr:hypothetical protein [Candidatus Hydrogenedentota bacterium]